MWFVIFQIPTDFLINQLKKYFCTRHVTLLLQYNKKAFGAVCQRGFLKHPRVTICLLVLAVGELYNISNKNQIPNRSVKYLLFYTKDITYLLHSQIKLALSIALVLRNIVYHIFTGFDNDSGV